MKKTQFEKDTLKAAKSIHKELKKNKEKYSIGLYEILHTFSKSPLPDWGGFVFNSQRVEILINKK